MRSAVPSRCLTEEGCHLVPPRGVRSCMASSCAAICCNVRPGAAALMPATNRTNRSSPVWGRARSSKAASIMPSKTNRRTVRRSRSTVQVVAFPRLRTRTTSPHGWSGRIRRTVGSQESSLSRTPSRCAAARLARTFRIASASPARKPGFPPIRPRERAAFSPALVRSAINARSSCATAPSVDLPYALQFVPLEFSGSVTFSLTCRAARFRMQH